MIARTTVVVEPGGRLGRLSAQPPLTVRRVHADRPGTCALCLVGSAAGPLAGDELTLDLHVRAGARASLVAAGASIAQGADQGESSRLELSARIDEHARLDADPGALVVCAGSRVDVRVCIALAETATVVWRELIVLGRTDAPAGAATLRWDVHRTGRPLLRQIVDLTDTSPDRVAGDARPAPCPGQRAGRRPRRSGRAARRFPHRDRAALDDHALLVTVLADDAATALADVEGLLALVV